MRAALLLALVAILVGCAPRKIRKCARAEAKVERAAMLCPELVEDSQPITVVDTVVVMDTVILPGARVDTFTRVVPGDSVVIIDTVTRTRVVVRWVPTDTAGLWARVMFHVKPDTLIRVDTVRVEVTVDCPPRILSTDYWRKLRSGWRWLWLVLVVVIIGGAVVLFRRWR